MIPYSHLRLYNVSINRELTDGCVLDYGIDDSSELTVALRVQSGMMVWCVARVSDLMMCVSLILGVCYSLQSIAYYRSVFK